MQERISSRDFAEWMAFYRLEPFGDERDDLRMARLATVISNTIYSVWTGKDGPFTEADMMLQFDQIQDDDVPDPELVAKKVRDAMGVHGIEPLEASETPVQDG